MLTKKDFVDAGYTEYRDNTKEAECLLQKRIRDKKYKTKYFINVYMYDFSSLTFKMINPISFMADVRFHDKEGIMYNLEIHDIMNVEAMEAKVEEVFKKMKFICDPHND